MMPTDYFAKPEAEFRAERVRQEIATVRERRRARRRRHGVDPRGL